MTQRDFSGGSAVKNPPASAGDAGDASLIPGSGRFPEEMATHSFLGNPMDRGVWRARVSGVPKS